MSSESAMVAAVLLITALVYLRCLGNGFVSDDQGLILGNRYLHQWSFLWKSLIRDEYWFDNPSGGPASARYRPLVLVWLWLSYRLFGLSHAGWHASMVAVHLLSVWLVFKVGLRLTGDRLAALWAALLFGLMPVQAEAVIWFGGFGLALAGAFELAALYLIMERTGAGWRGWIPAMAMYGAAMLSHETAATFPGLVMLYFLLLDRYRATVRGELPLTRRVGRAMLMAAPFAAEVALYMVARRLVLGFFMTDPVAPPNHFGLAQEMLTVPRVLAAYLALLVAPWIAGPAHRVMLVGSAVSPGFWLAVAILSLVGAGFLLALRGSARRNLYLFCAAWPLIALAPLMTLRLRIVDHLVHDSYLYFASVGWCVMAADWTLRFARRGRVQLKLACGAALAALALCGGVLWNVQAAYRDDLALFRRCVELFPESGFAHQGLGNALQQRGDFAAAGHELKLAATLNADDQRALYDLGMVEAHLGRYNEAARHISEGLKALPHASPYSYVILAEIYDVAAERAQVETVLKRMEELPEGVEAAAIARAGIAMQHHDNSQAEAILRGLVARHPDNSRFWSGLGLVLARQNRSEEAAAAYLRGLALAPTDLRGHILAALELDKLGRKREALDQCRQALAIQPDDVNALALERQLERELKS